MRGSRFSSSEGVLLITPPLLLVSTYLGYQGLVSVLGLRAGYFGGFLFYWLVWCLLVPRWVLGRDGLRSLFREVHPRFGRPAWLGIALLVAPLLLGYGYAFPRALPQADLPIILASAAIALVNGTLEEVLWRGAYVRVFPDRWGAGYLATCIRPWGLPSGTSRRSLFFRAPRRAGLSPWCLLPAWSG